MNLWWTLMSISEMLFEEAEDAVREEGSAVREGVEVMLGGWGFCTSAGETGLTAVISWEMVSDLVVTSGKPRNCPATYAETQHKGIRQTTSVYSPTSILFFAVANKSS